MTLVWGFRQPEPTPPSDGRPDFPRPGVCTLGGHLAAAVWSYGENRAICGLHRDRAVAAAIEQPQYGRVRECPKWSKKPNPKHEHGTECLL